jgi:hypothetical protein
MNTLKIIWLTLVQWVQQIWWFPRNCTKAIAHRRSEAERLDRIRNPSKYIRR